MSRNPYAGSPAKAQYRQRIVPDKRPAVERLLAARLMCLAPDVCDAIYRDEPWLPDADPR